MKQNVLIFSLFTILIIAGCQKTDNSSQDVNPAQLTFTNLVADDSTMTVNDVMNVKAIATGEGLTYNWTASYGSFIGSGAEVKWTVCHADRFRITCEVKDKYDQSISKDLYIRVRF